MIVDLSSFTHWAASAVLGNSLRGVLAEYIIAQAIGIESTERIEWDAVDLVTKSGLKLEVKSSAYMQNWPQTKPSVISFKIGPRKSWDAKTNTWKEHKTRSADVYVFAVFTWKDDITDVVTARRLVLDTDHWRFMVIATRDIDRIFKEQGTVRLTVLKKKGFEMIRYEDLAKEVHRYEP